MPESHVPGTDAHEAVGILARTGAALRVAATRRDTRAAFALAAAGYPLVYLVAVGDLWFGGGAGPLAVRVVEDLSLAFASRGFARFEAVALVSAGSVVLLVSPLDVLVGGGLATLVGANLALTYLGLVQPRACGLASSTGALAGIPALLSGAACCGPTILIVVGVQASATLVTAFQYLVPVAVVFLVLGLLLIGREVDPALL